MKNTVLLLFTSFTLIFTPLTSWAWGRQGHKIVGETAALLSSGEPDAEFMREHSFDFGYYANIPDFVWKRPATYSFEKPEHYVDLDLLRREMAKHPEVTNPFELSRKDFEAKFPEIKPEAGRAYWRIRELNDELTKVTQELRDLKEKSGPARQKLQEKWLLIAGVMAHYVGDLSMPLHVTENHDGQMTDQKGIHSYFEDKMVDQLYPDLLSEVYHEAAKQWPAFKKKNEKKSVLELVMAITDRSEKAMPKLLALDKKSKRDDIKKNVAIYHAMIRDRLVDSSLNLAEVYRRQLGWKFDGMKFFYFGSEPAYIMPSTATAAPPIDPSDKSKK